MAFIEIDSRVSELGERIRPPRSCQKRRVGLLLFLMGIGLWIFPKATWGQASQIITFTQPPPQQAYAGTSVLLAATSTSGLPVTFSVASGPAQVSGANGDILTFIGVGTVVVQADQAGNSGYSPASSTQAPPVTVQVLTEPVTTSSTPVTTLITFTTAGTLAQITALTQGAINLDFSISTATTTLNPALCIAGITYTVGQICSLQFAFKPTHPGIRYGGITLVDAAGSLLANTYMYGYGIGPQVLYQPFVQSMVGNSLGQPSGVAINGGGDLFVSNETGAQLGLAEISSGGTVSTVGAFTNGRDVAVDGSGNVFLITQDTLYEVLAVNGIIPASPVIRTLATGFDVSGGGLAIDGSGNAYIANGPESSSVANPTGVVYVVYAVEGVIPSNSAKHIIGPLFAEPTGVAVDQSGNVYVSDGLVPAIFEMFAVNGQVPTSPIVQTIGSGYVAPSNIRLDDTNDIFISDSGFPGVLEYPAINGTVAPSTLPRVIGSGFIYPQGLLVDDSGNVFVADQGYPEVVKLNYSTVPTLNFTPTLVGQTSTDSPQAVTYTNAGNADLIFTSPLAGTNPSITSGSTNFTLNTASSTCPQLSTGSPQATLAVGQSCTDQVSFTPTAPGPLTGTLTTVDNDLSVANATQNIQLNGTGTLETPTIQFAIANHFVDDPPFTVAATSSSPAPITYNYVSGPASIAGNTIVLNGTTGIVTLQAAQPQDIPYAAATATANFNVVKHSQTINFTAPPTPDLPSASPLTLVAAATSGLPITFKVLSGTGTISGNQLIFTGYGQIVIAADQAGNANYDPAPEVTHSLVVLDNHIIIAIIGTPNPVFLKNSVTFNVTVASPAGIPTGTVILQDGAVPLITLPLTGGTASFTTAALALGRHNITVIYSGDATFASTTSAPFSELVEDFSLTVNNADLTIFHGGTAVYSITLAPVGGTIMAGTIQLAITGNPDHSPLTFNPTQIAVGAGTTNVTLTIQTPDYPVGPWAQISGQKLTLAFLSLVPLLGFARKHRLLNLHITTLLLVLAISLSGILLSGCGSGWGAQPYSMTITAQSGALSHSAAAHLVSR